MNQRTQRKKCFLALPQLLATCVVVLALSSLPAQAKQQQSWISELTFPAPQHLSAPSSMAIDTTRQRYYVVDSTQGKMFSYDASGTALTEFDAGGKIEHPTDMCFARPGKLWVVERSRNVLLYIDIDSQQIREFSPLNSNGQPMFIGRIATDTHHNLFVSDRISGRIYALDDNLKIVTAFSPAAGGYFIDFKLIADSLWALDQRDQTVYQFNLTGKQLKKITLETTLGFPYSLALDGKNQIFVLDRSSATIHQFNNKGKQVSAFGQKGYRRGQLSYPSQLMFDWQQRLCVVNQGNNRIEVFSLHRR